MQRMVRLLVSAVVLGAATLIATAGGAGADPSPSPSLCPDAATAMFGPNVCVFTPSMPQADIQSAVNAVYAHQVDNEMGTERFALLFEPGTYGSQKSPLDIPVG